MPSRPILLALNQKNPVGADDVNVIYNLLNGFYDTNRGLGMPVKLTAFDGVMSSAITGLTTGLIDSTSYALTVKNRESSQKRGMAILRGGNDLHANEPIFLAEGGTVKAVKDASNGTVPTQVIVSGTPAGGVLSGTYPNPSFYLAEEYFRTYPKMVMMWTGTLGTIPIGWVLCDGSLVTMRDGSTFTTPNLTGRFAYGVDGSHSVKATFGNSITTQAAIDVTHNHPQVAHTHSLNGHTHTLAGHIHSTPNHTHSLNSHTHTLGTHTHTQVDHNHTIQHTHDLQNHTHNEQAHTHGTPGHNHTLSGHNHAGNFNWESHTHDHGTLSMSHTHDMAGHGVTFTGQHTHTTNISATIEDGSGNSHTAGPSPTNGLAAAGGVNLPTDTHTHTGVAKQTGAGTTGQSNSFTGTTGDTMTTGNLLSGGITGDSSASGVASGSTTGSGVDTTATDGAGTTNSQSSVTLALNGPNTNSTGNPVSFGTSGSSSTNGTGNITSAPTGGSDGPSPTTTPGTDGAASTGGSSVASDGPTPTSTPADGATTTGAASKSSIDATPPGTALYFIMKL